MDDKALKEEKLKEIVALISSDSNAAMTMVMLHFVIPELEEIAEHLRTIANSMSGLDGHRPYDPLLAPAPNRVGETLEKLISILEGTPIETLRENLDRHFLGRKT
jgi:hypothetical protein